MKYTNMKQIPTKPLIHRDFLDYYCVNGPTLHAVYYMGYSTATRMISNLGPWQPEFLITSRIFTTTTVTRKWHKPGVKLAQKAGGELVTLRTVPLSDLEAKMYIPLKAV